VCAVSSASEARHDQRSGVRSPLFWLAVLRVLMGLVFLETAFENVGKGLYGEGFRSYVSYLANGNPIGWYRAFLETSVLPNWQSVALFQSVAEPLMGLALILGVFSPLAGIGGVFFFANLLLASWGKEWPWTYVNMILILVAVAASGSGRVLGIDYFLARYVPALGPLVRGLAAPDSSD
jgi:thiosulfate dehydrogenase (quinone) large subunit